VQRLKIKVKNKREIGRKKGKEKRWNKEEVKREWKEK
jgi:hypothetical protein